MPNADNDAKRIEAPSWLWSCIVDLIGIHERQYLETWPHCRAHIGAVIAPSSGYGFPLMLCDAGRAELRARRFHHLSVRSSLQFTLALNIRNTLTAMRQNALTLLFPGVATAYLDETLCRAVPLQ
ncbi:hypothetical protein [Cupriavidus consociatus]|uniref:hypothetical protein n=1 Tax=Cupriavidus consociatus TaxID=2821357 RepID=UPI001AE4ED66|nr:MULTISPECIES: hypothetical protein [unclassified Cupriavidus]MBP0622473.1 hypothetical protein [Cupriavidus sp. LEh25]MDK2659159.1 hypothetical protein [Cupriavidus sp. LEh21]